MMTRELIEKFYSSECSAEEKQRISDYFREHPQELEEYFSEEEWNSFTHRERMETGLSDRLLNAIQNEIRPRSRVISMVKWIAIAASVLLVVGLGWKYFVADRTTNGIADVAVGPEIIDTTNRGAIAVNIILPDSSSVVLMPGSTIRHKKLFEADKRTVTLNGEAQFKVAKDVARPFTVYSREIATTALGTEFRVTAFANSSELKVALYEGKVVIRPADSISRKLKKDYYLLPGDEFHFNRQTLEAEVISGSKAKSPAKKNKAEEDGGEINDANNWYMFNNQSLAQVFEQLESIYNVKIEYNRDEIRGMNFIGRIERRDSVAPILRDIALLNNLQVTRKGNTYIIQKK